MDLFFLIILSRYTERLPEEGISDPIALLQLANEYNLIDLISHLEGKKKKTTYVLFLLLRVSPLWNCFILSQSFFFFFLIEFMIKIVNEQNGTSISFRGSIRNKKRNNLLCSLRLFECGFFFQRETTRRSLHLLASYKLRPNLKIESKNQRKMLFFFVESFRFGNLSGVSVFFL